MPETQGWSELTTPHFHIRTDVPESRAREIASYLELTRAAMLAAAFRDAVEPAGSTEVVVFQRRHEMAAHFGSAASRTLRIPDSPRVIVFSAQDGLGDPPLAAHELARDLTLWFMPIQPLWLEEGLATLLETVLIDDERQEAAIGRVPVRRFAHFKRLPLDTVAVFAARSWRDVPGGDAPLFLAQSWLLVHRYAMADPPVFWRFQQRLQRLEDWREAWGNEAGWASNPGEGLNAQIAVHLAMKETWGLAFPHRFSLPPKTITVKGVSPASAQGFLAQLALTSQAQRSLAAARAALELEPGEPYALAAQFYAVGTSQTEKRDIARRALSQHVAEPLAWVMAARAGLLTALTPEFESALRAEPWHPGLNAVLAHFELASGNAASAYEHARFALRRSVATPELLIDMMLALAKLHRCHEARAIGHNRVPTFSDDELAALIRNLTRVEAACVAGASPDAG